MNRRAARQFWYLTLQSLLAMRVPSVAKKMPAAGSAKALEPLAEFLSAMARALEAQQNRSTAKHVQLAKQLAKLLTAVGSSARSQELLAAFPGWSWLISAIHYSLKCYQIWGHFFINLTSFECNDAAKHNSHPSAKLFVSSMWHLKLDLILACQKRFVVTRPWIWSGVSQCQTAASQPSAWFAAYSSTADETLGWQAAAWWRNAVSGVHGSGICCNFVCAANFHASTCTAHELRNDAESPLVVVASFLHNKQLLVAAVTSWAFAMDSAALLLVSIINDTIA